jgi:hypothetical protein
LLQRTSFQRYLPSWSKRQRHFDKRLRLTKLILHTRKPPLLLSLQITSHFTQLTFFPPFTPPQRNSR